MKEGTLKVPAFNVCDSVTKVSLIQENSQSVINYTYLQRTRPTDLPSPLPTSLLPNLYSLPSLQISILYTLLPTLTTPYTLSFLSAYSLSQIPLANVLAFRFVDSDYEANR